MSGQNAEGQFVVVVRTGLNSVYDNNYNVIKDSNGKPLLTGDVKKYQVLFEEIFEKLEPGFFVQAEQAEQAEKEGTYEPVWPENVQVIILDTGAAMTYARDMQDEENYALNMGRYGNNQLKSAFFAKAKREINPEIDTIVTFDHSAGANLAEAMRISSQQAQEAYPRAIKCGMSLEQFLPGTAIKYDELDGAGYVNSLDYTEPNYPLLAEQGVANSLMEFIENTKSALPNCTMHCWRGGFRGYKSVEEEFKNAGINNSEHILPGTSHGGGINATRCPQVADRNSDNGYHRGLLESRVVEVIEPLYAAHKNTQQLEQPLEQPLSWLGAGRAVINRASQSVAEKVATVDKLTVFGVAAAGAAFLTAYMISRGDAVNGVDEVPLAATDNIIPKPGL